MVDDKMMVLVDELLQKGSMWHIFNEEERASVINAIRTSGDKEKVQLGNNEAWELFIK